jgi:hypothetical protein
MKQHITLEQLNLCRCYDKLLNILGYSRDEILTSPIVEKAHEQVTIGKMIEMLIENEGFEIEQSSMIGVGWEISYSIHEDEFGIPTGYCKTNEELCDALWEAMSDIL